MYFYTYYSLFSIEDQQTVHVLTIQQEDNQILKTITPPLKVKIFSF